MTGAHGPATSDWVCDTTLRSASAGSQEGLKQTPVPQISGRLEIVCEAALTRQVGGQPQEYGMSVHRSHCAECQAAYLVDQSCARLTGRQHLFDFNLSRTGRWDQKHRVARRPNRAARIAISATDLFCPQRHKHRYPSLGRGRRYPRIARRIE
jgi:hypothetical protein